MKASESRWRTSLAISAPYPAVLVVGLAISIYGQYTWQYFDPALPTIRAQAPGIWLAGLAVIAAGLLWLLTPWRRPQGLWVNVFLVLILTGWVARLSVASFRGDAYDLTVWLFPVVMIMFWLKFPSTSTLRVSLLALGWAGSIILVWTRVSELAGLVPMAPVSPDLVSYEVRNYWLPLAGTLGPEGRWPGPMGGTAFTGALGALLLVLGVAIKSKSSWVFGFVGLLALGLTSSRGAIAGAGVGVAVAILFGRSIFLRTWSFRKRSGVAFSAVAVLMVLIIQRNLTLTGRTSFWLDFLELWRSSPILGVGQSGYMEGTQATAISGTAHSLYIDELARNGLLGLVLLVSGLAVALLMAWKAAKSESSGSLALIVTVAVIGIVNTPFGWLSPSFLWMFFFLGALWAASLSDESEERRARPSNWQLGV